MSEIEWYLDDLFDQLAGTGTGTGTGTGAAGRRALMEAEYHLRAAAAGAMTRGLPDDQAYLAATWWHSWQTPDCTIAWPMAATPPACS